MNDIEISDKPIVKFGIEECLDINDLENNKYIVTVSVGRKRSEKKRLPLSFKDRDNAIGLLSEIESMKGKTINQLIDSDIFKNALTKFKVFAENYKQTEV